jgi:hypothetical protein
MKILPAGMIEGHDMVVAEITNSSISKEEIMFQEKEGKKSFASLDKGATNRSWKGRLVEDKSGRAKVPVRALTVNESAVVGRRNPWTCGNDRGQRYWHTCKCLFEYGGRRRPAVTRRLSGRIETAEIPRRNQK